MKNLFNEYYQLESLDLTNFKTSNITDLSLIFNKCNNLKEIKGINDFDTSKITNMSKTFS